MSETHIFLCAPMASLGVSARRAIGHVMDVLRCSLCLFHNTTTTTPPVAVPTRVYRFLHPHLNVPFAVSSKRSSLFPSLPHYLSPYSVVGFLAVDPAVSSPPKTPGIRWTTTTAWENGRQSSLRLTISLFVPHSPLSSYFRSHPNKHVE